MALESKQFEKSSCGWVIREEMISNQGQCMIVFILFGHRVAVFPMQIHKNSLQYHSPVSVIEYFFNISRSPYLNQLPPLPEIYPLILEQVLHLPTIVAYCFVVHILVVNIGRSRTPRAYFRYSDWNSWQTIRHYSKFTWFCGIVLVQQHHFERVKYVGNHTAQMRIVCQNWTTANCMLLANRPRIRTRPLNSQFYFR